MEQNSENQAQLVFSKSGFSYNYKDPTFFVGFFSVTEVSKLVDVKTYIKQGESGLFKNTRGAWSILIDVCVEILHGRLHHA